MAQLSRRRFLQLSALAGGGFAIGFDLTACQTGPEMTFDEADRFIANAWIRILPDSRVVVVVDRVEMGQGTVTSSAMLVAEELEVDPADIAFELAPADKVYANSDFTIQATGGSTSTKVSWQPLREAAAATRHVLERAGAQKLGVAPTAVKAEAGHVVDVSGNRKVPYGELTKLALGVSPEVPKLKDPSAFKVIGTPQPRLDAKVKATGQAQFGVDVRVPGALVAVVARSPVLGGTVVSYDEKKPLTVQGVEHVVQIPHGIAVVAKDYWAAKTGAERLDIKWDEGTMKAFDTQKLREEYRGALDEAGAEIHAAGNALGTLATADDALDVVYEVPYLSHSPMEPMNCTAHVQDGRVEVWAPTQAPAIAQAVAARILELPLEKVVVHQTFLGGGFGRRSMGDFVSEAVYTSRAIKKPVKVVWSREDDTRHGYFRPLVVSRCRGRVDKKTKTATAWHNRVVTQSVLAGVSQDMVGAIPPEWLPYVVKDYVTAKAGEILRDGVITDPTSMEGATEIGYSIDNQLVEFVQKEPGIPVGFWRSVGHSVSGFVVESFIDELAHAAGADPYKFRRGLLQKDPRRLACLDLVADKGGWGQPVKKGHGVGIAQHPSFGSFAGMLVEASVEDGQIRVHRVVTTIDCGIVVNPDVVAAQMESGIVYGLSAAMYQQVEWEQGRTVQSNFHDFPLLRISETPKMETHIIKSAEPPSGVGELSVPPLAAALANAIYAATGVRLRRLPMQQEYQRLQGTPT